MLVNAPCERLSTAPAPPQCVGSATVVSTAVVYVEQIRLQHQPQHQMQAGAEVATKVMTDAAAAAEAEAEETARAPGLREEIVKRSMLPCLLQALRLLAAVTAAAACLELRRLLFALRITPPPRQVSLGLHQHQKDATMANPRLR